MKKIFLVALTAFFIFPSLVFGADDFALGKAAFNKKDYGSANTYLVKYLTANPNDANARYYYAQTLTYLENYKQARIEYGYVMQLAPNTTVANYAKASLAFLDKKEAESNKAKSANTPDPAITSKLTKLDNYIAKAMTSDGEINTWDLDKMPIKVYIDNTNRPKTAYIQSFKSALDTWKNACGMFSFTYVTDPDAADVKVSILGTSPKTHSSLLGVTQTSHLNGNTKASDIVLYTLDKNYKPSTPVDFYNVALHETGHMLGIHGHSDDKGDIMYADYDKKSNNGVPKTLSQRDINTMKAIYSLDKNPYANGVNSLNRVLGSKNDRLNDKLDEEIEYVKNHPNSPLAYANAGIAYERQNKDAEAIEYYKKALSIDAQNKSANEGLARIYSKRNDLKNAEIYYKNLIKTYPKESTAYCNLTNLYIKNNKIQLAKSMMATLAYRNPQAKNDPNVSAIRKLLDMN